MNDTSISLKEAADIVYLTPETADFFENGDFLGVTLTNRDGEKTKYDRVWLHRSFPFDMPDCFISLQDEEAEEIGIIKNLSDFPENTVALLNDELNKKYYTPCITKILSLKETRGYSYWKVLSDAGELSFTLQDTQRSISEISGDRALINDVCGNRYMIESLTNFDKKSMRKLEIYL